MKHRMIAGLVVLFVCTTLRSQGLPAEGRDFYLGYLSPSYNKVVREHTKKYFGIFAFVSAYQDTKVYVSYFDSLSGKESVPQEYFVKALQTVEIPLDTNRMKMSDPGDLIAEYRSAHITSEHPVSVTYYSQGGCAGGEYLVLSSVSLGRKYVTANYNDNPEGLNAMLGGGGAYEIEDAYGYFMIISTHNGTSVKITPTSTTQGGKHDGVSTGSGANGTAKPYSVMLHRGQCYLVKSNCSSSDNDISGSIIESDKPVAVLSGHSNAGVGSTGTVAVEGRDYIIEQMIPHEYSGSTGFIALPMVDSSPHSPDGGNGENYRTNTFNMNGAHIDMYISGFSGATNMDIGRYYSREKYETEGTSSFHSPNNETFSVFQIDNANHSSTVPFPRPSMMTIVPKKNWRTSYLVHVPERDDDLSAQSYINVIAPNSGLMYDSVMVSTNGSAYVNIREAGFGNHATFPSILLHPEVKGYRYSIKAGTYHIRAPFPFMIYNYGYRIFSATGVVAYSGHDMFTSYAAPSGHLASMPVTTSLKTTYDTTCPRWDIHAVDTVPGAKVIAVMLLDDPTMDMYKPPIGHEPYVSTNCSFTINSRVGPMREIGLPWSDSAITITLAKDDPTKPSEAYLYIVTTTGTKLIHLENITNYQVASINGGEIPIDVSSSSYGVTIDSAVTFKNLSSSASYDVKQVAVHIPDTNLSILSVSKQVPFTLSPGDSVVVRFRMKTKSLETRNNFITLVNDCVIARQALLYRYKTGLIYAGNVEFGNTVADQRKCHDRLFVTNLGELPFLLKDTVTSSNPEFSLTPESKKKLPLTIMPYDTAFLTVCYMPTDDGNDSATFLWHTDISSPYQNTYKPISYLVGKGISTNVSWVRDTMGFYIDRTGWQTRRIYLRNADTGYPVIKRLYITGKNATEFRISGTQLGMPPNLLELSPHDSIYVDVVFLEVNVVDPTLTRTAHLVAEISDDISLWVQLTGNVDSAASSVSELSLSDMRITPNPMRGDGAHVSFTLKEEKKLSFTLYDMLGREVSFVPASYYEQGKHHVLISASSLPEGSYIMRVGDGTHTKCMSLRVMR